MSPGGIAVLTILLLFLVGILAPAPTEGSRLSTSCCTGYYRKPVAFSRIKGYSEQKSHENCRIDAIIFITINNYEVCATRQDAWVKKTLFLLSSRLKNMSKTTANPSKIIEQPETTQAHDGSGATFNTTDPYDSETLD